MAETYYANTQTVLNKYHSAQRVAMDEWSRSFPMAETNVDGRVYVRLGGREFEGGKTAPLVDFIATLQAHLADTPAGAEAEITFTAPGYDDDYDVEYEVGYWRAPTPKERAEREERNRKAREHNAALEQRNAEAERAAYEKLKAKFEPR